MFHERWRSFVPRLAPFPARPPSVSSLSKSIIPRFRREPDALLPAEIRRWWWLIVPPLSRDNEIFVCAMRPPVRPSLLIRHLDPPLPLSLSLRWIYSATIYTNWCILADKSFWGDRNRRNKIWDKVRCYNVRGEFGEMRKYWNKRICTM